MGRDATKAAGNPWYEARIKASKYDGRLASREGASDLLGMSVSSISETETGLLKFMPVDKAVLMADLYHEPQLLNYYCLHECPIGCRHSISDELVDLDRVTVKLIRNLKVDKVQDLKNTLLEIAADGVISEEEKPELKGVVEYLDEVAKVISELKLLAEMALDRKT